MVTTQGRSTTKGQTIKLQQCNTLRFTLVQQYRISPYYDKQILQKQDNQLRRKLPTGKKERKKQITFHQIRFLSCRKRNQSAFSVFKTKDRYCRKWGNVLINKPYNLVFKSVALMQLAQQAPNLYFKTRVSAGPLL